MVGMVQTALTNAMNTATAVTDLTEPVILDVRPDGKEYTAKIVRAYCIQLSRKLSKQIVPCQLIRLLKEKKTGTY